jgi:hypothetical protein
VRRGRTCPTDTRRTRPATEDSSNGQNGVFRRIIEELAADLQERGGIDIREAFIDGSKKGAMRSVGQNGAKGAESWQLRMLPVFLSPPALQVLRLMK